MQLVYDHVRGDIQSYIYAYHGVISQPRLMKLDFWRYTLDTMDSVTWIPYVRCELWMDNTRELLVVYQSQLLIGQIPYVIE